jgi:alkylated DNA nucleotide flippase Atl1
MYHMAKIKGVKPKWKPKAGTTWKDKLHKEHPSQGSLRPMPPIWHKRFGDGMMLIPRPLDLDALIRKVRKGKLVTQSQLREHLAKAAGADATCPITTGIFLRIVAEAAEEDLAAGKKRVTPYWRVVSDDGRLNPKLPGDVAAQARRLRQEGLSILPAVGKKPPQVRDYVQKLVKSLAK